MTTAVAVEPRQIHGFRFGHGPQHRLLPIEDAPAVLIERAREVVRKRRELDFRRRALESAGSIAWPDRELMLRLLARDETEAAELLMIAKVHYRTALRKTADPRDVLVVDGFAVARWLDSDNVDCLPLDGDYIPQCVREHLATEAAKASEF